LKHFWIYEYPIGPFGIAEADGRVTHVFLTDREDRDAPEGYEKRETPLIKKTHKQMTEYFKGQRRAFDLPLEFKGTDFQKRAWEALLAIPYGETRSYGEIAANTGNPKACRAVGMANNRNPIAIICPCHRVIGADGSLVGYGGGLARKEYLLELECKTLHTTKTFKKD